MALSTNATIAEARWNLGGESMFERNPHIRNENILFFSLDWSGCVGVGVTESGIYWNLKTNPENTLHMPKKDSLWL